MNDPAEIIVKVNSDQASRLKMLNYFGVRDGNWKTIGTNLYHLKNVDNNIFWLESEVGYGHHPHEQNYIEMIFILRTPDRVPHRV